MSNARNILPECYADTLLVEILGYKKPNYQLMTIKKWLKELVGEIY